MSQQTNSGFNAPGFSVCADDPIRDGLTAQLRFAPPDELAVLGSVQAVVRDRRLLSWSTVLKFGDFARWRISISCYLGHLDRSLIRPTLSLSIQVRHLDAILDIVTCRFCGSL